MLRDSIANRLTINEKQRLRTAVMNSYFKTSLFDCNKHVGEKRSDSASGTKAKRYSARGDND